MLKKLVLTATAALLVLVSGNAASAQVETPKVELGVQGTMLRFRDLDTTGFGFGGRATFNLTENFAIEGELNYFPSDKEGLFESGRKTQGLFGVKTGFRSETAGAFAKFRPGFIRFSRDFQGLEDSQTDLALDIGGVIEYYPSESSVLRFDIGDTIIRFGERDFFLTRFNSFTSHNLQVSFGVGVRF
jgi:hypothetical protein